MTISATRPTLLPSAAAGGFTMPAETAPHAACWMAWPARASLWGERLDAVKRDYALVARTIARFEPLRMVARPEQAEEARRLCGPTVTVLPLPLDDSWMRDAGPTFLANARGETAAVAWRFNAWGGKYSPCADDAALARRLIGELELPLLDSGLVAEGGALLSDGEGTVFTTESCLLNANRNPGLSRREVEAELKRCLGAEAVVWLPGDVTETETDGHIDGLASIVRPGAVLLEAARDRADPRFPVLSENRRALELARDARGRSFEILEIGEAQDCAVQDPRFCRSYINFYLANGAVILPQYGTASDAGARAAVARAFPDRAVVPLTLEALPFGGGSIHCITQQQPGRFA